MTSHSFKASENKKKMQMKEPLTGKGNIYTSRMNMVYFLCSQFNVYAAAVGLLPKCCLMSVELK